MRQSYWVKPNKVMLALLLCIVAVLLSSCSSASKDQKDDFYFYQNNQKVQCILHVISGNIFNPQNDYCFNTTGDYYTNQLNGVYLCKGQHSNPDFPRCDLQKSTDNWFPPYTYQQMGILSLGLLAFLLLFCTSSCRRGAYFIGQVIAYLVGLFVSLLADTSTSLGINSFMSYYIVWFFILDIFVLIGFLSIPIEHFFEDAEWYSKLASFSEYVAITGIVLTILLGWLIIFVAS